MTLRSDIQSTRNPGPGDDVSLGIVNGARWMNYALGTQFFCQSNAAGAAVWLPMGGNNGLIASPGGVLMPANLATVSDATPQNATDRIYFIPYYLPRRCTLQSFMLNLTATAGSGASAYYGLYSPNPDTGKPYQLLSSSGPATLTGPSTGSSVPISASTGYVGPGLIWGAIGLKSSVTTMPSMTCIGAANGQYVFSNNWISGFATPFKCYQSTSVSDYLPAGIDGNGASLTTTGTLTSGSPVITAMASTAGMRAFQSVTNGLPGSIPNGAQILSVDSATQITISANATASVAGTTITAGALNWVFGTMPAGPLEYTHVRAFTGTTPCLGLVVN